MLKGDARTEAFRRVGLFGGAAILGAWSADWIRYLADPAQKIPYASLGQLSWAFAAFGIYGAVVLHDRFLKAASIAFVAQNAAAVTPSLSWTPVQNVLSGVVALLLIVAGARHRSKQVLIVAVLVL